MKGSELKPVGKSGYAIGSGAVYATIKLPIRFETVTNDAAITMLTPGRKAANGTLKAVEGHGLPVSDDLKRFVVIVSANVTFSQGYSPF